MVMKPALRPSIYFLIAARCIFDSYNSALLELIQLNLVLSRF
jgi:hypothetical protein